jgi:hypothetical protein
MISPRSDVEFVQAREVSEEAFAQARAKLSHQAISALNDYLITQAEGAWGQARWQRLQLVAADASTVHFGLRASHRGRAASTDPIAFGLYLGVSVQCDSGHATPSSGFGHRHRNVWNRRHRWWLPPPRLPAGAALTVMVVGEFSRTLPDNNHMFGHGQPFRLALEQLAT